MKRQDAAVATASTWSWNPDDFVWDERLAALAGASASMRAWSALRPSAAHLPADLHVEPRVPGVCVQTAMLCAAETVKRTGSIFPGVRRAAGALEFP